MSISELFSLRDKVAVVTGGAGHLGTAISEAIAEAGATVYIVSRNIDNCRIKALNIQQTTGSVVRALPLDISSMESVKECFEHINSECGKIDILVNNAAFSAKGSIEDMPEENWIRGIDGTVNNVFRCTQAVLPMMTKTGSGSIINIASMYGFVSPDPSIYGETGFNNPPNYGAGKAAVLQFTRYAACHLADKGIRVNAISPGPFPTEKVQENEWFTENLSRKVPLGRIGRPHELKGVIVLLASEASSYITGVNIPVDGGWTAW